MLEGENEQQDSVATESEQQESQQDDGSSHDSGRNIPKAIPYERFQEIARKNQEYRKTAEDYAKFGTPAQIAERIQRLEEMTKSYGGRTLDEKQKIREELLEHLPEVKEYRAWKEAQSAAFVQNGEARLPKYMKEAGRDPNDSELNKDIQEMMAGRIVRNIDYVKRFIANDPTLYDDVWKQIKPHFVRRPVIPGADLQAKKLPPTPGKPGTQAAPKALAEKSERELMDEAHEEAWARISQSQGDE